MSELEQEFNANLPRYEAEAWLPPKYIDLIDRLQTERDAALEKIRLLEGAINILRE